MTSTVELHGHRGARGLYPENTLLGFEHALALGVDAVELDVCLTADDVVVLNHDQVLSPVNLADTAPAHPGDPAYPYVGKAIRDLTLAQIKTLDAGVRHSGDALAATQHPAPGTPVPTLTEVCALLAPSDVRLGVELKTDPSWPDADIARFTDAVADVLTAAGLLTRSRLLAFDWRVLTEAGRKYPALGRVALVEHRTLAPDTRWLAGHPSHAPVAAALAIGATAFSPEHVLITPGLVDEAHAVDLPVVAWTVNDPEDMSRLTKYGVDAIVTDYPNIFQRTRTLEPTP